MAPYEVTTGFALGLSSEAFVGVHSEPLAWHAALQPV